MVKEAKEGAGRDFRVREEGEASFIKGYLTGHKTMNLGHSHPHSDVLIALSSTTGLRNRMSPYMCRMSM